MVGDRDSIGPEAFVAIGAAMLGRAPDLSVVDGSQRFRALFGTSPSVFCRFWQMFVRRRPENSKPYHMLWAIIFLKVYASEHDNAALAGLDEKTSRKCQWTFVRLIARLKMVSFN